MNSLGVICGSHLALRPVLPLAPVIWSRWRAICMPRPSFFCSHCNSLNCGLALQPRITVWCINFHTPAENIKKMGPFIKRSFCPATLPTPSIWTHTYAGPLVPLSPALPISQPSGPVKGLKEGHGNGGETLEFELKTILYIQRAGVWMSHAQV